MDDLAIESYKNAHDLHKFYAAWRFKVLGFIATINGALFYSYATQDELVIKVSICFAGILSTVLMYFVDKRNYEIMKICLSTAQRIEQKKNLNVGLYTELELRPVRKYSYSYSFMIAILSGVISLYWVFVLLRTLMCVQ